MKLVKKLILSLSIVVTMCIAFVIGCVGHCSSAPKSQMGGGAINNTESSTKIETPTKVKKPTTYTYAPNEIKVRKGENTLNYTYTPSVNSKDTATAVAYEYCFGNPMNQATAVNLKSIDTTGVNVSFYYSDTKLDTTESVTGETRFTLQKLPTKGSSVYIYVIVSPTEESIPTTFTTSLVWYYGIPEEIPVLNNLDNVVSYQTIVSGQEIDENTFAAPSVGYYFDSWYLDEDYTQMLTGTTRNIKKIYARSTWFPWDRFPEYMTYSNGSYSVNCNISEVDLRVPAMYDDGVNGRAPVTKVVGNNGETNGTLGIIRLPSTITTIGIEAFCNFAALTSIDFSSCVNLTGISYDAFWGCSSLTDIDLSNSKVTNIGSYQFNNTNLTNISLPETIDNIGSYAFQNCTKLESINIPSSVWWIADNVFEGCTSLTSLTFEDSSVWTYTMDPADFTDVAYYDITAGTNYATLFTDTYSGYDWFKGRQS